MVKRSSWQFIKPQFITQQDLVAAKTPTAADAGAQMLERGGNAVDAAVAAAFASGVCEPYMSGIGGGGYMLLYLAEVDRVISIDFSMVAPAGAEPSMFELADEGHDDFFGWRNVRGAANFQGYLSVGVPGAVAGLATALERYGRLKLADVLAPAVTLARDGFEVSWFDTVMIAQFQDVLERFDVSRSTFLPDGHVPVPGPRDMPVIRQPLLADTLETIGREGPQAVYSGSIGAALVAEVQANGGVLAEDDLRAYKVRIDDNVNLYPYRAWGVAVPHTACGSTTVLETLRILEAFDLEGLRHNTPVALDVIAQASRLAFVDRYERLAGSTGADADISLFLSDDQVAEHRERVRSGEARSTPAGRLDPAGSSPGGSTTHLSTVDREGNLVTLTQTLLQLFGSGVVSRETGILLNDAMAWFDPVPGRSASVASGKRPLTNMSPLLALERSGGGRLALGASGGRKIMQAVLQIAMNAVDHGLALQDAVDAPRIDCSGSEILANSRLDQAVIQGLRSAGHDVTVAHDSFTARHFASPACAGIAGDGRRQAGLDPYYPAAAAGH